MVNRITPFVISGAIIAAFVWSNEQPQKESVGTVVCEFAGGSDQPPIPLGSYRAPLRYLKVTGEISDPFEDVLYHFDGHANFLIEGHANTASVRGSMFTEANGDVKGVILTVENPAFGRDGLSVLTLNENDRPGYSKDQAFAYISHEFKRSHPLFMRCETSDFQRHTISP